MTDVRVDEDDLLKGTLAAIVASSDDAIYAKDTEAIVRTWNPGAERLYGYSPEEAIGRHISFIIPEHRHGEEKEFLKQILAGERLDHYETERVRKDGAIVDVSLTISPIKNRDQTIIGASVIARDISERKQLDAVAATFIANAAHELRTPLAALTGFAGLLAMQWRKLSEAQIEECLSGMQRQGERARLLINNLLDLSKLERGDMHFDLRSYNLGGAVRGVMKVVAPPEGVSVTVEIAPDIDVLADDHGLEQILINLLTNAFRYGGANVVVAAQQRDGRVLLSIEDDGPGVPEEIAHEVFEPFARGTTEAGTIGSGLGLAIVKRLMVAFGGNVMLEKGELGGARFVLSFRSA